MNKPDGITQEAWEEAGEWSEAFAGMVATGAAEYQSLVHLIVARAIQSAVEAERGRCMGIALSFIQYGCDTHHGITENPMADVRDVAAAIRKGA